MVRRMKAGFTLIELMVVILILGILAGVIGVAVSSIIGENKASLDAQSLTQFNSKLGLVLAKDARKVRSLDLRGDGTAAALFCELASYKLLGFEEMKKLAGASGSAGTEDEYEDFENASALTTAGGAIIFTAPADPGTLVEFSGSGENDGSFFMCYNEANFVEYRGEGLVGIRRAVAKAEVYEIPQIPLDFKKPDNLKGKTVAYPSDDGSTDFYGPKKWPVSLPPK